MRRKQREEAAKLYRTRTDKNTLLLLLLLLLLLFFCTRQHKACLTDNNFVNFCPNIISLKQLYLTVITYLEVMRRSSSVTVLSS